MARSEDEVKRAKQARAAHARAVRAANKEKREKLKANRIALMARARANKAQSARQFDNRMSSYVPSSFPCDAHASKRDDSVVVLRLSDNGPSRPSSPALSRPHQNQEDTTRPPACDEAGSRLIDVQKAEVDPINPCIRVCTSDHAAEPPVRVMSWIRYPSPPLRALSKCDRLALYLLPGGFPLSSTDSAPGDLDRHGGQDPPKPTRSADPPDDNGRDARADSPPADPVMGAKPQLCSNPGANEHSSESQMQDDHRLPPQPVSAATEVAEPQQAGNTETHQAGSTETKEAGSTETKEAGSADAPEDDKPDWVDDACEYWGERYTSLKMRIDMLKGRKEKGRSIDENKLMYYRKINYEIQKKRKRERDIKRAALKKDAES
ncbi:hypothetical protein CPLU01_15613 [Colletotrichum plurivorum]|uniref:Uncharacterized protein n=1 Tax=Colletotrichum plurivorum TaxID=2175906 RepID=A0A8H6J971_9PEZI|nr:hypothetical protein CPLU01_15613 [Colletotrichum plurivorum]